MMYKSFGPELENHPAFVIGHLTCASAMILDDLGGKYIVPKEWDELFQRRGPDDPRTPDTRSTNSPNKAELLSELNSNHQQVVAMLQKKDDVFLKKPIEWRFDKQFPTIGECITFMCITHEAMHLGQLAAWRRAAGLKSSLGRL